jgi:hypothetical protein
MLRRLAKSQGLLTCRPNILVEVLHSRKLESVWWRNGLEVILWEYQ